MSAKLELAYNDLKQSLTTQLGKYKEIILIVNEQKTAIQEVDELKFSELMIAKNDLLELINKANESSIESKEYWDEHFEEGLAEWRIEMKDLINDISQTIQEILKIDDELKKDVEKLINDRNNQSVQKSNIKKLKSAYGASPEKDNFINKSQ